MNKERRKDLDKIREYIEAAKTPLDDALADLESVKDEEQEAAESVEENFPGTERAEAMAESASSLEEAHSTLESLIDELASVLESIEEAQS